MYSVLVTVACVLALYEVSAQSSSSLGYRLEGDPTYLIIAPNRIYPNEVVQVSVSILKLYHHHINVRASIRKDGEEHASFFETFTRPSTRLLQMQMLENSEPGNYTLRVEGSINGGLSGNIFENETDIYFDSKQVSVFIQTNKPLYKQGQIVYLRIIPVQPNLMPAQCHMRVYVKDPSGVVVKRWLDMETNAGILELEMQLSDQPAYGTWTVEVDTKSHTYTKNFIVEEFFLPRFFVNVSMPHYIMDDTFALAGLVTANHTSGRPVRGNGIVKLEIRPPLGEIDQTKENNWPTLQREIIFFEGRTDFLFTIAEMREIAGRDGARNAELHVTATVNDWYLLRNETGYAVCVIYGRDVKLKLLGDKSRTFKPGSPVNVYYAVQHADGSPLYSKRRQVTIHRITRTVSGQARAPDEERFIVRDDGIVHYSFVADPDALSISITAYYDSQSGRSDAPRALLELYRTFSLSNNYIHIETSTEKPEVHDYMLFTVRTSTWVDQVDYLIVSGGNIILIDTLEMSSLQKTFSVALSRDMVPSARLVAYYIINGEVVADALNFHVDGTFLNEVDVVINKGKDFSRDTVELSGRTDPGSFIAFSGMDYETYAKGTNIFISEEDVIEEMETYDSHTNLSFSHTWYYGEEHFQKVYFPAPSYGVDANTTFAYAGLLVFSDANVTRMGHMCNESVGLYPCMDGTCFREEHRCDGVSQCTDHLDEMGCEDEDDQAKYTPPLLRYKHTSRHFEEDASWLWKGHFTKPDGQIDLQVEVPKEPMSWVVSAVSMSRTKGLGVMKQPVRHQSTRPFYIRVEMPSTAARGEQIGVRVALFNYWHENMECIVTLHDSDEYRFVRVDDFGVVSSYAPRTTRGNIQTMAYVFASKMVTIYMPVLPVVYGDITVTVSATSPFGRDSVTLPLHIKYDGVTNYYSTPYLIDLLNYGSLDVPDFGIPVPEIFVYPEASRHLYVADSANAYVTVVGDVVGPGFFEPYLNAENLMRMPYGAAESNMFNFAANLYFLLFMKEANRLDNDVMNTALENMNVALQRQMSYFNNDGSFSMFRDYPTEVPSTWATAFALETLQAAALKEWNKILYVDTRLLNRVALWLCNQVDEDGAFVDHAPAYDRKLWGEFTRNQHVPVYDKLSLTAYVLQVLAKANKNTGNVRNRVENAKSRARAYIEEHLLNITEPYQATLVTYALTVSESLSRGEAYSKMMKMNRTSRYMYWSKVPIPENPSDIIDTRPYIYPRRIYGYESQAVEASSYALLVLLENNEKDMAQSIMWWLQTMRNSIGGFSGTRDTVVALQALSRWASADTNRDLYNIWVNMAFTSVPNQEQHEEIVKLNRDNWVNLQRVQVPRAFGQVMPTVQGTGMAIMQLHTMVNVEFPDQLAPQPEGKFYNLSTPEIHFHGKNFSILEMTICTQWLNRSVSPYAGMTVIEVDVPTGYMVMNDDLRRYVQSSLVPTLRRAEFKHRTVSFYFDTIRADRSTCVRFRADRWYPVANATIQHKLKVYDYYEPGMYTLSLYTTYNLFNLHICQVCGSFQCPYCPFYNAAPTITQHTALLPLLVVIIVCVWNYNSGFIVYSSRRQCDTNT